MNQSDSILRVTYAENCTKKHSAVPSPKGCFMIRRNGINIQLQWIVRKSGRRGETVVKNQILAQADVTKYTVAVFPPTPVRSSILSRAALLEFGPKRTPRSQIAELSNSFPELLRLPNYVLFPSTIVNYHNYQPFNSRYQERCHRPYSALPSDLLLSRVYDKPFLREHIKQALRKGAYDG